MPLNGQTSDAWRESSSALRILNVGIQNSVGNLTADSFTQTNPPIVATAGTISTKVSTTTLGVLSGSVAFSRPDAGANYVGGNIESGLTALQEFLVRPLGVFINSAVGNAFENTPGTASGKGPYVSAQGTYANALYETQAIDAAGAYLAGDNLTYETGMSLIASRNGYLMPSVDAAGTTIDVAAVAAEREHGLAASTVIGILKMPADSTQSELVYDQRI
jgi:hypothetical protein